MNYRLVFRHFGVLVMLMAVAMVVCLGLGYLLPSGPGHSGEKAPGGWAVSIAITFVGGFGFFLFGRREKGSEILRREAVGIVGLGWLVCSVFASLPYLLCGTDLSITAAYFEGVSGLTTTGATVLTDLNAVPDTVLLWRSQTEWMGGIGILAMFVLVLARLGASGKSLFQGESSADMRELVGSRMRETVRSFWVLYIFFTVVCGLGLWSLGMTPFQAVNHALTTVSTGGFGTENDSINGFGASIRIWMMIFMVVSSISFPLYLLMLKKRMVVGILRPHEETWIYATMLIVVSGTLVAVRAVGGQMEGNFWNEVLVTVFNAVSIGTTSGFAVGDYDAWPALAKGLILSLMIIGGCAGSTTGGLKVSRMILWAKMLRVEIRRAFRPHQTIKLHLNGRPVPDGTRGQLFVILTSAVAVIAVSTFVLVALEPDTSSEGCLAAVIACVSNIGPAFGEFGPTKNFASLSSPSMILLSVLMIIGRLEYIAVLALFSKTLWRKY